MRSAQSDAGGGGVEARATAGAPEAAAKVLSALPVHQCPVKTLGCVNGMSADIPKRLSSAAPSAAPSHFHCRWRHCCNDPAWQRGGGGGCGGIRCSLLLRLRTAHGPLPPATSERLLRAARRPPPTQRRSSGTPASQKNESTAGSAAHASSLSGHGGHGGDEEGPPPLTPPPAPWPAARSPRRPPIPRSSSPPLAHHAARSPPAPLSHGASPPSSPPPSPQNSPLPASRRAPALRAGPPGPHRPTAQHGAPGSNPLAARSRPVSLFSGTLSPPIAPSKPSSSSAAAARRSRSAMLREGPFPLGGFSFSSDSSYSFDSCGRVRVGASGG